MQSQVYGSHKMHTWDKNTLMGVLLGGKSPVLKDAALIGAFNKIDRADFVPEHLKDEAYMDREIDLGHNQKMESPVFMAQFLEALDLKPGQRVLQIGTGSGFSTALLAHAVGPSGKVYSMERNQFLLGAARENLAKYKDLTNIELVFKDGSEGLLARAPYDAIYVAFSMPHLPKDILKQLKLGGKAICPHTDAEIGLYTRETESEFEMEPIAIKEFKKVQYEVE